jgi:hypothetical protein
LILVARLTLSAWLTTSRIWHGAVAAIVLAALLTQVVLVLTGGTDVNAVDPQVSIDVVERLVTLFSYFTIQSNILVLIAATSLAANPIRDGRLWRAVRLDALLGIGITGIVYVTILAGVVNPTGAAQWANIGFHYVSPWATLAGWLLFGPRPRITWSTVAAAFAWPVAWIIYTFLHGALTGWFPYPFLDVNRIGYAAALRNTALVFLMAGVVVLIAKALDHVLPRQRR